MDKKAVVESILRTVRQEVEEWVEEEEKIKDPFEYEKRLLERVLRMGKTMAEESGGKLVKDRNSKKSSDRIWQSDPEQDTSVMFIKSI